ncbi:MAG: mobile mystery protein B [Flavobacteriaceae bacterium]|nr:mobile mystery protein B [Flavobacteriaceae bacterium]MCY4215743.1 mobile mystery protein B [Flavobacteriaceae bacterium]MCY4268036.1 mobile mystery protein B [Flavobacteriaceae bacterium]MCY4298724.1 mobile mystery protein B [Flavobacteriaceae bacterium]
MALNFKTFHNQTPLDQNETDGLRIKHLRFQEELNEFEHQNVEKAIEWTMRGSFNKEMIFTEKFIKEVHFRMFGDVWNWAGKFRKSEKNLGVSWPRIGVELKQVLDDTKYWITHSIFKPEEIAIRFKHKIVQIHCFPNGNGRHSRLMADILIEKVFNEQLFTWGFNIKDVKLSRKIYIDAIKEADIGNIEPLLEFAKN